MFCFILRQRPLSLWSWWTWFVAEDDLQLPPCNSQAQICWAKTKQQNLEYVCILCSWEYGHLVVCGGTHMCKCLWRPEVGFSSSWVIPPTPPPLHFLRQILRMRNFVLTSHLHTHMHPSRITGAPTGFYVDLENRDSDPHFTFANTLSTELLP